MQSINHLRRLAVLVPLALATLAATPVAWAQRSQEANTLPVLVPADAEDLPRQIRNELVLASDGNIYFSSVLGGQGAGAVGRLTSDGVLTTLYAFKDDGTEGVSGWGRLIQASDLHLYGTAYIGGTEGLGTLFRVALDGTFTVLHNFGGGSPNAAFPYTGVTEGPDGYLYGTTHLGGTHNKGTVYRIATDGSDYAVIHHFNGSDGENPQGALVVGADGLLYGTTLIGGASDRGAIYRISTTGAFELLYSFPKLGAFNSQGLAINATGANPKAGMILSALDGNFYGTAFQGGPEGNGTLFRMTPAGDVSVLHAFGGPSRGGSLPVARVTQDSAGNFYGTTSSGGYLRGGSVWRIAPDGAFTMLHGFAAESASGTAPHSNVLLAHDTIYFAGFSDTDAWPGAITKLDLGTGGVLPAELYGSTIEMLQGESVTFNWTVPSGTTCRKFGGPLAWTGEVTEAGSQVLSPSAGTYVFGIACTDPDDGDANTPQGVRNAYTLLSVRTPPLQPVDGGGGAGSMSLLWLLLMAALLSPRIFNPRVS
ncbi:MAG TPA: choice-of-anchor tandem repeat GloVer-containing protein [Steroidobacteraceae bacterium]|nr:choice-of-anchor tandem repeat GloVer-containing protein [Steroidobacteraceae bacterium]